MNKLYRLVAGVILFSIAACNSTSIPHPKRTEAEQTNFHSTPTISSTSPGSDQRNNLVSSENKPYPRHPLNLVDQVLPESDFFQFRDRLRKAVRQRDARFIRTIATPNIKLTFGRTPRNLDSLELDNPKAPAWLGMDKAFSTGCSGSDKAQVWTCPHVFRLWLSETLDAFEYLAVVGEGVNVRSRPSTDSSVISVLSNEAVKRNREVRPESDLDNPDLWTAITLSNGQPGYILNRYVYSPVGYRSFFRKVGKEWKMDTFIAGD